MNINEKYFKLIHLELESRGLKINWHFNRKFANDIIYDKKLYFYLGAERWYSIF